MKKILLISLMILAVCLVGCEEKKVEEVVVDSSENQVEVVETTNTNLVAKLNSTKDYVYNAEYEKNVSKQSYTTEWDENYYADSIIVPFINIDSEYAAQANSEIKQEFDKIIKQYNDGANGGPEYVDVCTYTKFEDDDVLSVLFYYGLGATDIVHPKYFAYNINLKDGSMMSFEEIYKHNNFDNEAVEQRITEKINEVMNERMASFDEETKNKYIDLSVTESLDSMRNNKLLYCLNQDGKLEVVVALKIPAGTGSFDTLLELE